MLADYLNQTCILSVAGSKNAYGNYNHTDKEIVCRKIQKFKRVINNKGEEVTTSAEYWLLEEVKVHDMLDGKQVISCSDMVDLDGITEGYKVYLV